MKLLYSLRVSLLRKTSSMNVELEDLAGQRTYLWTNMTTFMFWLKRYLNALIKLLSELMFKFVFYWYGSGPSRIFWPPDKRLTIRMQLSKYGRIRFQNLIRIRSEHQGLKCFLLTQSDKTVLRYQLYWLLFRKEKLKRHKRIFAGYKC